MIKSSLNPLIADKNNSWLRIRYGRLSVDSDDQNFNKKCDIDDEDDGALMEYKVECCDKINDNAKSQIRNVECNCLSTEVGSQINTTNPQNDTLQKSEATMNKLMSMELSDYGMFDDLSLFCRLTLSSDLI